MNNPNILSVVAILTIVIISCNTPQKKASSADTSKTKNLDSNTQSNDKEQQFEKGIYLKTDAIYSGRVYTDKNNKDVFYRILEIPEEENIRLIAEKIAIGEEGGNYQLIRRIQLTEDNSLFPKFGLSKVDSIKFVDSVNVNGYFNGKKMIINLESVK